jgi:Zn-dependent protease with chaperone function
VSFAALLWCLALIWYAAAMLAGSALAAPLLAAAGRIPEPSLRAERLVLLRALPTVAALVATGLGLVPAFLWLEPRQTTESVSAPMMALAAAAAATILVGPVKGLLSLLATRRLIRRWERSAKPIRVPGTGTGTGTGLSAFTVEESFPVAVVVGSRHPRLFLARSVLASCEPAELAAVVAHEIGHLRRGDHWKGLLMRAAPDALSILPFGVGVERRWAEAAEQLADEHASTSCRKRALDLASALVKVARLVARSHPPDLPLIALYRGEGLAGRIERLLRAPGAEASSLPRRTRAPRAVATLGVTLVAILLPVSGAFGLDVLHRIHDLAEGLVLLFQ